MTSTAQFCTTCGSKKAARGASPSISSPTPSPAPSSTSTSSSSFRSASPATTPTPTVTITSTSTSTPTPSSTSTSSSGPTSALDRFRSRTDSISRSGSSPNLTSASPPSSPIPTSSSSSSLSSSSSSSSSSSIPSLTGTPEQQLEELKKLYASKSAECDQLKSKLMSGLPSSGSSTGGSQTALLEGKVKSLETKIASEIRQRELAEKRYEATKQELDDMKKRREAARQRMQSQASTDVSAAKARNAIAAGRGGPAASGSSPAGGAGGAGAGGVRAPSKRSTRVMTKGPPVGDIVNRILAEMARVEAAVKKAEEDRLNAENELLEVGLFKQAAEDRFGELSGIVEQVSVLVNNLQILIATKCGSVPDVKAALQDLHGKLDSLATRAGQLSKGAAASSHAAVAAFATSVGAPPPPPPPPPGALLSYSTPAASSSGAGAGSRASTLLSQIRRGATLKTLDAKAIKDERDKKANEHRKSVTMLSALQSTLRDALANRQDSMNPDSDDETWDWED